jgi:hypothetical protein
MLNALGKLCPVAVMQYLRVLLTATVVEGNHVCQCVRDGSVLGDGSPFVDGVDLG